MLVAATQQPVVAGPETLSTVVVTTPMPVPTTWPGATPAAQGALADPQARAAADPATSGHELMAIAAARPDLRPAIALNPASYPPLLDWLGNLGDPSVAAALALRQSAYAIRG